MRNLSSNSSDLASLKQCMTTKEAALMLGLNYRTLERLRATGNGPRFIPISKTCVRYLASDIVQWIDSRAVKSTYELVRGSA